MKKGGVSPELLEKIRKGLIKSGFPLELQIAKIIQERGWSYNIASQYLDFETNKLRESDIVAYKTINSIDVNLMIECKKSEEKQLILYQPKSQKKGFIPFRYAKAFPDLARLGNGYPDWTLLERLSKLFAQLPVLSEKHQFSNSIIFTKGENVEQNNTSFFSSVNSIVKRSIANFQGGSYRRIYIYIVIYDGIILKLTHAKNNDTDFDLSEISYGQYLTDIRFTIPEENLSIDILSIQSFGNEFVIEIMNPNFFPTYLDHLVKTFQGIDKTELEGWGQEYEDLPF